MKRFLRSKLVLTLAALVMLVGAIAIPLSGSILHSHAANPTPVPLTNINGTFYTNPNDSGSFDPSASQVFTQPFPVINLNPPTSMQNCSNSTGVDEFTRPFTDVVQNSDGSCSTIIAQDNSGDQAGVGNLFSFQTVFLANFTVPSAGTLTFNIYSDDGWIMSVGPSNGNQPTPDPNNIMTNPPPGKVGPITGYPEMGDNNVPSSPAQLTITVNIPAAGTYPLEQDYTECCGGQLTQLVSATFTPTTPPTRSKLFILIQGVDTRYTQDDINHPQRFPGFQEVEKDGHEEGIVPFLKTHGYSGAQFIEYSYTHKDSMPNGQHTPYDCADTFTHPLSEDVLNLNALITNYLAQHTNTDVYLIGHSQGGVVAFGELAYLKSQGWPALPNGGQLKGVITLDSPLGGIPFGINVLLSEGFFIYHCGLNTFIPGLTKENLLELKQILSHPISFTQIKELAQILSKIFKNANLSFQDIRDFTSIAATAPLFSTPLGGKASIMQILFPVPGGVNNQKLAEDAKKHGISVLTVGNKLDFVWDSAACFLGTHLPFLDILTTQVIADEGDSSGVYGRAISSGNQCSLTNPNVAMNHGVVKINGDVDQGIRNFLPNGGEPKPLQDASKIF